MNGNEFTGKRWLGSFRSWRRREKVAFGMAAVIVFIITYALILPAITAVQSPGVLLK